MLLLCEGYCGNSSKEKCPLERVSDTACIGSNMVHVPGKIDHKVHKLLRYW